MICRLNHLSCGDRLVPTSTGLAPFHAAPHIAVLLGVGQRAAVVLRDPRTEEQAPVCAPAALGFVILYTPIALRTLIVLRATSVAVQCRASTLVLSQSDVHRRPLAVSSAPSSLERSGL